MISDEVTVSQKSKPKDVQTQEFAIYKSPKPLSWHEAWVYAEEVGGSMIQVHEIRHLMADYIGLEEWEKQWFFDNASWE